MNRIVLGCLLAVVLIGAVSAQLGGSSSGNALGSRMGTNNRLFNSGGRSGFAGMLPFFALAAFQICKHLAGSDGIESMTITTSLEVQQYVSFQPFLTVSLKLYALLMMEPIYMILANHVTGGNDAMLPLMLCRNNFSFMCMMALSQGGMM